MLDDYKSISFLAGVSILLLIPIGIGAFTYSTLTNDESSPPEQSATNDNLGEDSDVQFAPVPTYQSETGGSNADSTEGIPTGKYSNPPTNIETGSGMPSAGSRSRSDFDSSVDRNRLRQQTTINSTPDYSAPSSSNSYNEPEDNSLVAPLEDDSFLETPENETESVPLSPVAEPLFQR